MIWTNKVQVLFKYLKAFCHFPLVHRLNVVNSERRNDQLNKVSYETFEIIMDRLEKEWFDLVRPLVLNAARSFANISPVQEHTQD